MYVCVHVCMYDYGGGDDGDDGGDAGDAGDAGDDVNVVDAKVFMFLYFCVCVCACACVCVCACACVCVVFKQICRDRVEKCAYGGTNSVNVI